MKSLIIASMLALVFTFAADSLTEAKGIHVASSYADSYVPQKLNGNNVKGGIVPSNWVESYGSQTLENESQSCGGYVATSWADTLVVQSLHESDYSFSFSCS
ncbi:MAG: hypothetical protein V3R67_08495 [Thermodesulfobacteriota bacterium]|jgi:hypothetical protein